MSSISQLKICNVSSIEWETGRGYVSSLKIKKLWNSHPDEWQGKYSRYTLKNLA